MITSRIELVTPSVAEKFLAQNKSNRKVRPSWVDSLADSISRGEWLVTHQGIAFNNKGELIDGQHRLMAILQSKGAVKVMVTRGLKSDAFSVLDNGIKRTLTDQTNINRKTAEICTLLYQFAYGVRSPSAAQTTQIYNCGVGALSDELQAYAPSILPSVSTRAIRSAAVAKVISGVDKDYVFDMYRNMTLLKYTSLPPIAHSMLRQNATRKMGSSENVLAFSRGWKVFDPLFAKTERLVMTDSEQETIMRDVRTLIRSQVDE